MSPERPDRDVQSPKLQAREIPGRDFLPYAKGAGRFDPTSAFFQKVLDAFHAVSLEVVLLGNAAAMMHGSHVATKDADFLFRDTPRNRAKIKAAAKLLGLTVWQPFYPASEVFRMEGGAADIDLMPSLPGWKFESFRAKAVEMEIGRRKLKVAPLELVIQLKEKAGRPKDKAVLPLLRQTQRVLAEKAKLAGKKGGK